MLLQLEQECLDIYRRKVEKTRKCKADLSESLAESEAEISNLISALGEQASCPRVYLFSSFAHENGRSTLKERISAIKPTLEDLRLKKEKRIKEFSETRLQIGRICAEISGNDQFVNSAEPQVNEADLTVKKLGELKSQLQELQYEKLQDLASTLIELWSLMNTSSEEQKRFDHVTCLISSSLDGVSKQGCLALDIIEQVILLYSRPICNVNLSDLLSSMDDQIAKAKEQALSRKDILDKVEKWKVASGEENWLDEYETDENRYSAGRGAHKNLKRAEKARILVSKIPFLVENLTVKVKAWETEKGIPFLYEKAALLNMLEDYAVLRQEKEEEKRRSRDQKRLQEQFAAEQEALYGSRPAVKKPLPLSQSTNANTMAGTPTGRRSGLGTPSGKRHGISGSKDHRRDSGKIGAAAIPLNYVAIPKDDLASRGN
ncbi:hypothetical protein RHGRI_019767 [Rhododendron griersonianum]|uniref:Uncharacterized protein n=1 Tax=Rhododendron griersonianum TaxID=479676 RepID=A0AAV6JIC8_9ERIC|nr:hypothetical protein RHGRI_019767 [Rhododendron griersonianum]